MLDNGLLLDLQKKIPRTVFKKNTEWNMFIPILICNLESFLMILKIPWVYPLYQPELTHKYTHMNTPLIWQAWCMHNTHRNVCSKPYKAQAVAAAAQQSYVSQVL